MYIPRRVNLAVEIEVNGSFGVDLLGLPVGQGGRPEEAHAPDENWPLPGGDEAKVEALQERPDEHTSLQ